MKKIKNLIFKAKESLDKLKLNQNTKRIIFLILIIKAVILVFGLHSYLLFSNQELKESYQILGIWHHWDAKSYISIAYNGYASVGERRFDIAFFPFYPFLVSVLTFVTGDAVLSGVIISGVASVLFAVLLHKLVSLDYPEKIAMSAVWFLFIFPTSYFLHIPYTESVFLMLVVGSFYCVRRQKWLLAGLLGCLACATRVNGLILCLALPFEIWLLWKENKKFDVKWFWLGLIPIGFVAYLILNYAVMGNPLAFLEIQKEHWQKYLTFPWVGIWEKIKGVYYQPKPTPKMEGFVELIFVALGLFASIAGWRYLRNSYRVWMIASLLLFVSTSFVLSVPRYTLTMFPLFILIALYAKTRIRYAAITTCSIIYLAMFIISFVQGRWAF